MTTTSSLFGVGAGPAEAGAEAKQAAANAVGIKYPSEALPLASLARQHTPEASSGLAEKRMNIHHPSSGPPIEVQKPAEPLSADDFALALWWFDDLVADASAFSHARGGASLEVHPRCR